MPKELFCPVCHSRYRIYTLSLNNRRVEECIDCGLHFVQNPTFYKQNEESFFFNNLPLSSANLRKIENLLREVIGISNKKIFGEVCLLVNLDQKIVCLTATIEDQHINKISLLEEISSLKNNFNFIFLIDALNYLPHPSTMVATVNGLLRNGGEIFIITPSADKLGDFLKMTPNINTSNIRWLFSGGLLSRLFYLSGFGCVKVYRDSISWGGQLHKYSLCVARKLKNNFRLKDSGLIEKLSVVMPVFNEESSVAGAIDRVLAKKIPGIDIELIVIESNSSDRTREIVLEYNNHPNVKVLLQDRPAGKGNAVRYGLESASGDYILIQDGDDEYDIEDYDALVKPLIDGNAAFVLGARHGGKAWKMRHFEEQQLTSHFLNFGHVFFTALVNFVYGLNLRDPFTMYKVFRRDCLEGLSFECNRFDFDYELLIKLVQSGYVPIELPVNYRSRSFKEGKKVSIFRDPITWIWAILKFKLQR